MPETTSKLFHRLRGRESGKPFLSQERTDPTCAQVLQELLEQAGVSAPEWIAAADISKSYAYQILRGKNLKTGETTPETRAENFEKFGKALDRVLDLNNWKSFLNTLGEAGYISSSQITSENALIFNYTFYLIGRYEFKMEPLAIKRIIRRWFYASNLAAFYVGSFESDFEKQLNEISELRTAEEFASYFDRSLAALMTDDYFLLTLPNDLNANEATGPSWQGFVAAQVVLGCKALFSTVPVSQLISDGASGTKKAVDKHHLFPDNYLKEKGYLSNRSNRANFTYVDYGNNIYISDEAPSVYVAKYREELGEEAYREACDQHALPDGFESMNYEEFLSARRSLMAQLIKKGFERL